MKTLGRLRRLAAWGLCLGVILGSTACQGVKPWEREHLARTDMAWDPDALEATRRAHVQFSKEASLPGGSAGGGGCGCN